MQRIDVLIVAALVVAAAASAMGVLTYEDDRFGEFSIAWSQATEDVEIPGVSHTGPGEVETMLDVTRANLTRITFTILLGGGAVRLQPTAIRIDVVSPTNNTTSVESELPVGPIASVDVPIEVDLASTPDATSISGPSVDAARNALNATLSSSLGIGTWTIRASFAPTAPGPLGAEAHTLGGTATLESYQGDITLVGPGVGR